VFPGEPGEGDRVIRKHDALFGQLELGVTVFDATTIPTIRAAGEQVEAQRRWTEEEKRKLAFQVAETYLTVLTAERTARVAERRVELAEQVLEDVRARFEAGLFKRSDLNRAELEHASARLEATRTENALRLSRLALYDVVAAKIGPVQAFEIDVESASEDALLEDAQDRPDLLALSAEMRAAARQAEEPWMRLVPSLELSAVVTATNETGFVGQAFNWDVILGLTWALYDGGLRYAEARARAADARIASLLLSRQQRAVTVAVRSAMTELDTARAAVMQAERRLELARENADEVRARYGRGLATAIEQADAAVAEFEAGVELERQRFLLVRAQLDLRRAVGAWPLDGRPGS
jgi:outer membrane protein TolC